MIHDVTVVSSRLIPRHDAILSGESELLTGILLLLSLVRAIVKLCNKYYSLIVLSLITCKGNNILTL